MINYVVFLAQFSVPKRSCTVVTQIYLITHFNRRCLVWFVVLTSISDVILCSIDNTTLEDTVAPSCVCSMASCHTLCGSFTIASLSTSSAPPPMTRQMTFAPCRYRPTGDQVRSTLTRGQRLRILLHCLAR